MKRYSLFFAFILFTKFIIAQDYEYKPSVDPFCKMILKLYDLEALRFNSRFKMKQVFEEDTSTSYAHVIVRKKGTNIKLLHIIPHSGEKELLFCNDSVWHVDHQANVMDCIGTNLDHMTYNGMSAFFPFTLFSIDTLIAKVDPFWKVIEKTGEYTTVALDINNASADISDIRVEFTIGNEDILPFKTLQETTYMKADNLFQELIMTEYNFPSPESIYIPDYFYHYEKSMEIIKQHTNIENTGDEKMLQDIYLNDLDLSDLTGKKFALPDSGLIFLDLWYVGCAPCMKSAPELEMIYNNYKDQIGFFSVNETDHDIARISLFKDKMGISFPVLLGRKGEIAGRVTGGHGYPLFILVDASTKKVHWYFTGYTETLREIIEREITGYL